METFKQDRKLDLIEKELRSAIKLAGIIIDWTNDEITAETCILKGIKHIVINKNLEKDKKIEELAKAFKMLGADEYYLKPILRDFLDEII